jgi:DNA repair protein RecN (Recombination protein N)
MLLELAIRNFAIIRDLRVAFSPGFQALTGETGAGKSIIIDALGAVLGSRLSSDLVRTDADSAWVEAVFDVSEFTSRPDFRAVLADTGVEAEDGMLILTRDIRDSGRSVARVNGRTVPARALAAIGEMLVDIHGQSEHLSLLRPAEHLLILDRYAGTEAARLEFAQVVRRYQEIAREIDRIQSSERERAQRVDLLRFQVEEIEAAALREGEEQDLLRERQVLNNAERLRELAQVSYQLLEGGDDMTADPTPGALDNLRRATELLDEVNRLDPGNDATVTQIREALFLLEESAPAVRDYAETIEADPSRLEEVEERLLLLKQLQRKYGATVTDILAFAETAAGELATLESSEQRIDELRDEERRLLGEISERAGDLSRRRRLAATTLEQAVEQAIADLHMGGAQFAVDFAELGGPLRVTCAIEGGERERPFDVTGVDRVEFLIAPNAGESPRSLARIASGGETARLMLALKSILSDVDATPTLVFDEVDVGVGGRSGQAVGEKLWGVSRRHQVIVISHLPQIAAFAERHYRITKLESGGRTETQVDLLDERERVDEIAAMLDGAPVTDVSRRNAEAMIERIAGWTRERSRAGALD